MMQRLLLSLAFSVAVVLGGCASRAPRSIFDLSSVERARLDSARIPYTVGDIEFMAGMIPHHAQAVVMGGWAESHGARQDVLVLAQRIVVAQRDEIQLMQTWLRDRNQRVPPADATHHRMVMDGMTHDMLMPGMLTDAQMKELDAARGSAFDRLFLTYMIGHHQGAITMVNKLFATDGAGQDETVFRFASDVYADQTTEIARMQSMLETVPGGGGRRPE